MSIDKFLLSCHVGRLVFLGDGGGNVQQSTQSEFKGVGYY